MFDKNFVWFEKFDFTRADGTVVVIDKPVMHDEESYDYPKNFLRTDHKKTENDFGIGFSDFKDLDNPMKALRSLEFKEFDRYDETATYEATFFIPFDAVQELALGFFVLLGDPKVIETNDDGVILQCQVSPVCNLDERSPKAAYRDTYGHKFMIECWFDREIEAGNITKEQVCLSDDEGSDEVEHNCEGMIYDYAVAVKSEGSSSVAKAGRTFDSVEYYLGLSDEEKDEGYEGPDLHETVVSPDGKRWDVLCFEHQD